MREGSSMVKASARFWVEAALAVVGGALGLLTVVWRDWIEAILGVEPDGGDGSLEWGIATLLLAASLTFGLLARAEWRRRTALA
jgi:hypothetical protein